MDKQAFAGNASDPRGMVPNKHLYLQIDHFKDFMSGAIFDGLVVIAQRRMACPFFLSHEIMNDSPTLENHVV